MAFYNSELYWIGFGTAMLIFCVAMIIVYFIIKKVKKKKKKMTKINIKRLLKAIFIPIGILIGIFLANIIFELWLYLHPISLIIFGIIFIIIVFSYIGWVIYNE